MKTGNGVQRALWTERSIFDFEKPRRDENTYVPLRTFYIVPLDGMYRLRYTIHQPETSARNARNQEIPMLALR